MISKDVLARVSQDGLNGQPCCLELVHRETGEVLETLPLRNANPQDRSYILSTWVRSYAPVARRVRTAVGTAASVGLDAEVYLAEEPTVAESLWQKSLIVGSVTDPFTIHAWVCASPGGASGAPGRLWHCYVPPELRNKGIAKALIKYICGPTLQYARPWPYDRVPSNWTYNPYMLGVK